MSIGVAAKEFLDIGNSTTTDGESNGIAHGGSPCSIILCIIIEKTRKTPADEVVRGYITASACTQYMKMSREESPEMSQMLERRAQCNLFAQLLGIRIVENRKGYSECELEIREEFLNPFQVVHGGCIYTLADVTVGNAASSYGMIAPTLEGGLHFLASSKGTKKLRAVAEEMHHGKTIMVFSVSVFDDAGKTIASGTFSFFNTKRAFSF